MDSDEDQEGSASEDEGRVTKKRKTGRRTRASSQPAVDEQPNTLFDAILSSETALSDLATSWLESYTENAPLAIKELVNLILKSCGAPAIVQQHDVEHLDMALDTITEIQDVFTHTAVYVYPLTSKAPKFRHFKNNLLEFFTEIIDASNNNGLLFDSDSVFIDTFITWISSFSSSQLRPFRYVATIILLNVLTVLCDIITTKIKTITKAEKQLESEKSRAKPAKTRIKKIGNNLKKFYEEQDRLEGIMKDVFDTIFVHRYRDVDPKIRSECIKELGKWTDIYPEFYFQGQYLRYFGWVLSDINPQTRLEVIRALIKLYRKKDMVAGFRQFTERFKNRMIEMALYDADHNVRIVTLELLNVIRELGFLDDEDEEEGSEEAEKGINQIFEAVFDYDEKIRHQASKFIFNYIQEQIKDELNKISTKKQDIGDLLSKHLKGLSPNMLFYKKLAHILYNANELSQFKETPNASYMNNYFRLLNHKESRISIASQSVFESISMLSSTSSSSTDFKAEELLKYILFDFSTDKRGRVSASAKEIISLFTLDESDEVMLLDILYGLINANITNKALNESSKNKRKRGHSEALLETNGNGKNDEEDEEDSSNLLIEYYPEVLSKFINIEAAIGPTLRLINLIDLPTVQLLRKEATYIDLFKEILKTFTLKPLNDNGALYTRLFIKTIDSPIFQNVIITEIGIHLNSLVSMLSLSLREIIGSEDNDTEVSIGSKQSIASVTDKLIAIGKAYNISNILKTTRSKKSDAENEENEGMKNGDDHSKPIDLIFELLGSIVNRFNSLDSTSSYNEEFSEELEADIKVTSSLLRLLLSFSTWQLEGLLSESEIPKTELEIVDSLGEVSEVLRTVSSILTINSTNNNQINSLMTESSLVFTDLLIAANVYLTKLDAPESVHKEIENIKSTWFDKIDKNVQYSIFRNFLLKEAQYAKSLSILVNRDDEEEVFDYTQEANGNGAPVGDELELSNLELQLCHYLSKLKLLESASLLDEKYSARLRLNASNMGPLFNGILQNTKKTTSNVPIKRGKRAKATQLDTVPTEKSNLESISKDNDKDKDENKENEDGNVTKNVIDDEEDVPDLEMADDSDAELP